jgi:hypothetical protein
LVIWPGVVSRPFLLLAELSGVPKDMPKGSPTLIEGFRI